MSILNDIDKLHRDVMPHIPQGIEKAAIDLAFRELGQKITGWVERAEKIPRCYPTLDEVSFASFAFMDFAPDGECVYFSDVAALISEIKGE